MDSFSVEGIDVEKGLATVGGRFKSYKRILTAFYTDGIQKVQLLESSFADRNINEYMANESAPDWLIGVAKGWRNVIDDETGLEVAPWRIPESIWEYVDKGYFPKWFQKATGLLLTEDKVVDVDGEVLRQLPIVISAKPNPAPKFKEKASPLKKKDGIESGRDNEMPFHKKEDNIQPSSDSLGVMKIETDNPFTTNSGLSAIAIEDLLMD